MDLNAKRRNRQARERKTVDDYRNRQSIYDKIQKKQEIKCEIKKDADVEPFYERLRRQCHELESKNKK